MIFPGARLSSAERRRRRNRRRLTFSSARSRATTRPWLRLDDERALVLTTDFFNADRRRPWRLGADRRGQRALRRVRDGRTAGHRAEPDRVARRDAARCPCWPTCFAAGFRRRGGRLPGGGRAHHRRPRAQVRHGGRGLATPSRLLTIAAARPGDTLVLTKAIGTGVVADRAQARCASTRCLRRHRVDDHAERGRERGGARCGVVAATTLTGFSLLGHLHRMLRASGVSAVVDASTVPLLPVPRADLGRYVSVAQEQHVYLERGCPSRLRPARWPC